MPQNSYNCLINCSRIVDAITTPASNRRTNLLTEIASTTLCLQLRSPRIIRTDSCLYKRTVRTLVKETCGDLRTSRFWALWPHILSGRCLESNAKQNSDWLACMGHSKFHAIPGGLDTADGQLSPCVQTWSESESCYQFRTKARISGISGPGLPVWGRG